MKKLIPALALLLVSAVLLATSSFAWFSMNTTVTVTGMQVTTKVSSNLQIKEDTLASTTRIADANFTTAVDESSSYLTPALLEPVSTVTGKAFFYTTNALSTGDAAADDYKAYNAVEVPTSGELTTFNNDYSAGGTAVGYVDYVFQLKATNTVDSAKDIKITKLDLIYSGAADASKAYRVALFVEDLGEAGSAPAGGSGTLKGIYAPTGAANQTPNYAVSAAATAPTALAANYNTVGNIATVAANKTNYYKVVLRLYLEGEDTTCKNDTFAALTGDWKLNVEIKLDDDVNTNTAVSAIGKYTSAVVETTTWFYDGTYVWDNVANIGTATDRTAIGSADAAVKTAFGYVAP